MGMPTQGSIGPTSGLVRFAFAEKRILALERHNRSQRHRTQRRQPQNIQATVLIPRIETIGVESEPLQVLDYLAFPPAEIPRNTNSVKISSQSPTKSTQSANLKLFRGVSTHTPMIPSESDEINVIPINNLELSGQ